MNQTITIYQLKPKQNQNLNYTDYYPQREKFTYHQRTNQAITSSPMLSVES